MAARWPFWKWHRWKLIGFCLWPPSTCIWNLKLKFQSKLDLCSGNHVVYRQTDRRTDGRTDKVNPVYPPPTLLGGGINIPTAHFPLSKAFTKFSMRIIKAIKVEWLLRNPNWSLLNILCLLIKFSRRLYMRRSMILENTDKSEIGW